MCVCSVICCRSLIVYLSFFFNDTATTEIYTLSLHDALPICEKCACSRGIRSPAIFSKDDLRVEKIAGERIPRDRKSTRLNSSHTVISYAVFCLKKKNTDERFSMARQILGRKPQKPEDDRRTT